MSTKCCENNYPIKNDVVPTLKTEKKIAAAAFEKRFRIDSEKRKEVKSLSVNRREQEENSSQAASKSDFH